MLRSFIFILLSFNTFFVQKIIGSAGSAGSAGSGGSAVCDPRESLAYLSLALDSLPFSKEKSV